MIGKDPEVEQKPLATTRPLTGGLAKR
jgi:hypothetical protein